VRALQALRDLVRNPNETHHVFTVIDSLSGAAPLHMLARFRASASGKRLLASRSDLLPLLRDRRALEALPDGSLGRAYLAFLDRERINAEGLVQASIEGRRAQRSGDFEYVASRLRDTHDLWHAVSGYHGDLYGEVALLAFSCVQTRNPGIALIVLAGLLRARDPELFALVRRAIATARRAEWLPAVEWEQLLALPLDEVRRRLRVEPAPDYQQVRETAPPARELAA
jgi:ubiquinone biosynthesis protein COQ4